jgi:DNA-binding LacI/PurR family transcriptional regulator
MPAVTIQTVAEYACVSRATVSRVLNHNPTVNQDIRERVLEAARVLGYQPNRAARRLRTQSRDVVGVIISDIQNPHFTSVIRGIEDAAYEHQMNMVLCNSDENSTKLLKYLRLMQAEAVAGLIVVPAQVTADAAALRNLQADGMAVIVLDRTLSGVPVDTVKVDNVRGACEGVKHLLHLGYRRIGIIYPDVATGHERYQGYVQAFDAWGLRVNPRLVAAADYRSSDHAYRITRELLSSAEPVEALFTANNLATLGALHALRELGRRVPADVALVGFDDMPWAEELYTPLTVVAQPTYELGQQAVQMLLRRLDHPGAPFETVALPTRLIVRASCGVNGLHLMTDRTNC